MRASERCKATMRGDRCKKYSGHDSHLNLHPDEVHEGQNLVWTNSNDAREKNPVSFRKSDLKKADKFLDAVQYQNERGGVDSRTRSYMIEQLNKFQASVDKRRTKPAEQKSVLAI